MAASQNGGGRAIKMVEYGGRESNSRIVKTVLGLKQVGQNQLFNRSRSGIDLA